MVKIQFTGQYLNLLVFLWGVFTLLFYYETRKKKQRAMVLGNFKTLETISGGRLVKPHHLFLLTRILAVTLLITAVSQPVLVQTVPAADADYVFAIDTSGSMFADDIRPTRFDAAKAVSAEVIRGFANGTRVGVVSYAGEVTKETGSLVAPGTAASVIADIEMGESAGTAIGGAITASTTLLLDTDRPRRVVLVTDGRNNAGIAMDEAIRYAVEHGAAVHPIGIGGERNATTTDPVGGENGTAAEYPNLDVDALEQVANMTGGNATFVSNRSALEAAFQDVTHRTERDPLTSLLVMGAVLLLVLDWLLRTTDYAPLP